MNENKSCLLYVTHWPNFDTITYSNRVFLDECNFFKNVVKVRINMHFRGHMKLILVMNCLSIKKSLNFLQKFEILSVRTINDHEARA